MPHKRFMRMSWDSRFAKLPLLHWFSLMEITYSAYKLYQNFNPSRTQFMGGK